MDDKNNENDVIDVENYEELSNEINGDSLLFYTTAQVAAIVGVAASTIRFWSKRFEGLLDIQISNRNRQFKKSDIDKLSFIKKLSKDEGLTLQQVDDYCATKGFDIDKQMVQGNNPLAIQTFVTAMTVEMDKKFDEMQEKSLAMQKQLQEITLNRQEEMNNKLQQEMIATVDEVVSEKLDSAIDMVKIYMDKKELIAKDRDTKLIDSMKENMRVTKERYEMELTNKKKQLWLIAWFQNIFHKKK